MNENTLPKNVIVLGSKGQVGKALLSILGESGIGFDHNQMDLANVGAYLSGLEQKHPTAVINAAAYTAVDLAEQNQELAMKINGEAPGILAHWCAERNIPFIHYSTDYVFSGDGTSPWKEEDSVFPLSAYGRTKLEGERKIISAGGKYLIFRTSWVYDAFGTNFLNTMLRLGREKKTLRVVSDQTGAPTYAPHLAQGTFRALAAARDITPFPSGIYHLCNTGATTWQQFASVIFDLARKKGIPLQVNQVEAILTSEYPTLAKRPLNSRLNIEKVNRIFGVALPEWRLGLEECLEQVDIK